MKPVACASTMPIRLPPPLVKAPEASGPWPDGAVLPARSVFVTVVLPPLLLLKIPPPLPLVELPERVLLRHRQPLSADSAEDYVPHADRCCAAAAAAELAEKVLFVTVSVPVRVKIPPPLPLVELPVKVLFVTVSAPPKLLMPPPKPRCVAGVAVDGQGADRDRHRRCSSRTQSPRGCRPPRLSRHCRRSSHSGSVSASRSSASASP